MIVYRVVRAVVYEGGGIADVAATWPTATVTDSKPDRQTREYIGRSLREGLSAIDRKFCGGLDPRRNYLEPRASA